MTDEIPTILKPAEYIEEEKLMEFTNLNRPIFVVPDNPIHPTYYQLGGIEVWDAIDAWGLDYFLGNAVKYISRAGKKDPTKYIEDLEKAKEYIDKKISLIRRNAQ